ncbi:PREDICTED: E3 ubiquitin-protein ligase SINA-like 2, partial [Camelina sativa]|uniref:RING-type E3 ubiquitin transferase n=1 Tax=Camelina sativa TaxID=90675 RepID=A0ABM0Y7F4_CAMSA
MDNAGGTSSGDVMAQHGILFELDLLDCPICCLPLTSPIFQCENGHIQCYRCYKRLMRYKCPSCSLPVGNIRSRLVERIVEAVNISCPNARLGCTKKWSYSKDGRESSHQKECSFTLCYCPDPNCYYTGAYKDLAAHFIAKHKANYSKFRSGQTDDAWLRITEKVLVLQENEDGPLVVVQCLKGAHGLYVTVNCIAPPTPGVGEFSYRLLFRSGIHDVAYRSNEMTRIQKLSFETP